MTKMIDSTFGLSRPARTLMTLLDREPTFLETQESVDTVRFMTYPWYNGRERGVALVMYHSRTFAPSCVVVFGEERRSDAIFVDTWATEHPFDPPSVEDFTDEVYAKRVAFGPSQLHQAEQHIIKTLEAFYRDNYLPSDLLAAVG